MPEYKLQCQKCKHIDYYFVQRESYLEDWECLECGHTVYEQLPARFSPKIIGGTPKFYKDK